MRISQLVVCYRRSLCFAGFIEVFVFKFEVFRVIEAADHASTKIHRS